MPRASQIALLPENIRAEVEAEMIRRSFGDYAALAAWIKEQFGEDVSEDKLQRHGQRIKRMAADIQAKRQHAAALAAACADQSGDMESASIGMLQSILFDFLLDLPSGEITPAVIERMAKSVKALATSGIMVKQYAAKVDASTKAVAEKVGSIADIPDNTRKEIRKLILGIAENADPPR